MAAAGAALPFAASFNETINAAPPEKFPLRLFSKPLDTYDFSFMCEVTSGAGLGGFDLTIRKGGKVEPAAIDEKLPGLISVAKDHNLVIDMMVTDIVNTTDPLTEKVLKSASASGITHYRLGYLEFDTKLGIWESLQKYKNDFKSVAELNRKFRIHGDYQNHAGSRVGGPVWDLYELLRDIQPELLGCQYDVRHAMVEGTNSWIIGFRLLNPWVRTLAIKDFIWKASGSKPAPVTVPMGEGMVNWDTFFRTVKELNISGPVTLHVEYPLLEKGEETLPLQRQKEIITAKIKKDTDFVKGYINKYQLG
jgi:sugar phosphate isomerase/epimerase